MRAEDYEARFHPSEDDKDMMDLAYDISSLMHNSNYLGRANRKNESRMDTIDNIIGALTGQRIELEKRIDGLEDYLFRGKDNAK